MSQEVIQRWDVFLKKIEERFNQIMTEARAGCEALFDQSQMDPIPITNAMTGVKGQLFDLKRKIDDTWHEKVEPAMEQAGVGGKEMDRQRERGTDLSDWMEIEFDHTEILVFADAARKIRSAAQLSMDKQFLCTQCRAELPIPDDIFIAVHVTCQFCNTVNTYEPGTIVRMIDFCAHHLAQEAAWEKWLVLKKVERVRDHSRETTLSMLKAIERASIDYWTTYLKARIPINPGFEKTFAIDLKSKLRPMYDDLQRSEAWVHS